VSFIAISLKSFVMMRNWTVLLSASLIASAVAEPVRWRAAPVETAALVRRQGQGVPDDCTFFDTPTSADQDCEYFASVWGISVKDFIAWASKKQKLFISKPSVLTGGWLS
jgi:hypothetical protein